MSWEDVRNNLDWALLFDSWYLIMVSVLGGICILTKRHNDRKLTVAIVIFVAVSCHLIQRYLTAIQLEGVDSETFVNLWFSTWVGMDVLLVGLIYIKCKRCYKVVRQFDLEIVALSLTAAITHAAKLILWHFGVGVPTEYYQGIILGVNLTICVTLLAEIIGVWIRRKNTLLLICLFVLGILCLGLVMFHSLIDARSSLEANKKAEGMTRDALSSISGSNAAVLAVSRPSEQEEWNGRFLALGGLEASEKLVKKNDLSNKYIDWLTQRS